MTQLSNYLQLKRKDDVRIYLRRNSSPASEVTASSAKEYAAWVSINYVRSFHPEVHKGAYLQALIDGGHSREDAAKAIILLDKEERAPSSVRDKKSSD